MPNTDGSLIIGVDLSLTQAEKQLKKFEGKVEETEDKINDITAKRDKAKQDGVFQAGVLDAEKAKLEEIKSRLQEARAIAGDKGVDKVTRQETKEIIPEIQQELSAQQERVRGLQSEWNKTEAMVTKYDNQLLNANMELDQNKAKAGELADKIREVNKPAERFKQHLRESGDDVDKLGNRLKRLMSRVMVFSVFTLALRSMRTWMVNIIKTNDQAAQAMAKLKGALLTMVQPLVNIVIPAFISLVQVLTNVALTIAQIISSLFGATIEESAKAAQNLQDEQDALKGVGKEAKKAEKSLASFDEINQLQGGQSADVSGAGAAEIAPSFDFEFPQIEESEKFLNAIKLIGAALLAWKLPPELLNGLDTMGTRLKTFAGLIIAIKGATELAKNIWDAWENGFNLNNLTGAILGAIAVIGGLQLAFGNVGGAAGLLVSGLMILVTAIKDITENGLTLENGIAALVGIFMMCLSVGKLVGASFGTIATAALVVASGIAMMVIGFQDATENGWNLENMLTAVAGIILTGLGISLLTGSWIPALIAAIASLLLAITVFAGNGEELINNLKDVFSGLIEFVTGVFTGDWEKAWDGVKKVFTGIWNTIVTVVESAINIMIKGINWLISKLNTLSFDVPDWVPGIGGQKWGINISPVGEVRLPRLAQGAVIPPNREFAAVLGDQTNGNNLEAPESLIRQIVREESGGNYTGILQQILAAIKEGKVMVVDQTVFAQIMSSSMDSEDFRRGSPMVSIH